MDSRIRLTKAKPFLSIPVFTPRVTEIPVGHLSDRLRVFHVVYNGPVSGSILDLPLPLIPVIGSVHPSNPRLVAMPPDAKPASKRIRHVWRILVRYTEV